MQASQVCGSGVVDSNRYNWCAYGAASTRVLYYLHGNGESERSWGTAHHQALERAWGSQAPAVIAISLGPTWFMTRVLADSITRKVIPEIEGRLSLQPKTRLLFGESMGGFNALQLYYFAPNSFSSVAVGCPALLNFTPQASSAEVEAYIHRHSPYVVPALVRKWRDKLLRVFPNARSWAAHDPLQLATGQNQKSVPLFVHAQGADAFGFHEGTEVLVQNLTAARAPVEYHFTAGAPHCQAGHAVQTALAKFLAR